MSKCPVCHRHVTMRKGQKYCTRDCQLQARYRPPLPASHTHIIIPDTQTKPGIPIDHLEWIGRYINEKWMDTDELVTVIHLGDHWDFPSLSSYDQGKRAMEGRRALADIHAGNEAFKILDQAIGTVPTVGRHFLLGNHEDRVTRAVESDAQLEGLLSLEMLDTRGWVVHDYLDVLELQGVSYSHYFYNPNSGRPYSGANIELRLKTIGKSFTMGHQQGLAWARRELANGGTQIGLVAGSCYLHEEEYRGPQANEHWRGIIVCHNVENGSYDPMFVSLDYLARRFVGRRLADYAPEMIL